MFNGQWSTQRKFLHLKIKISPKRLLPWHLLSDFIEMSLQQFDHIVIMHRNPSGYRTTWPYTVDILNDKYTANALARENSEQEKHSEEQLPKVVSMDCPYASPIVRFNEFINVNIWSIL